jgi:hypothetical protein
MSKKEALWISAIVIVVIGAFAYYMISIRDSKKNITAAVMEAAPGSSPADISSYQDKWVLPGELNEISSNILMDNNRMACIQDNDGIIYIYNLTNKSIDQKIEFAGKGDYEGLVMVNDVFYALRADGFLSEISIGENKKATTKTYDLPFTVDNDTEAICYDSKNRRLLIVPKEKDLHESGKKGVYAFDLQKKQMSNDAIFFIGSPGNVDEEKGGKKNKKGKSQIRPSEISIHPVTGDLYILDGPKSVLYIADSEGRIKSNMQLDKKLFPQPEGMCFDSQGELYISSEAAKNSNGVIVKMKL